jgi:hypothetical protein
MCPFLVVFANHSGEHGDHHAIGQVADNLAIRGFPNI